MPPNLKKGAFIREQINDLMHSLQVHGIYKDLSKIIISFVKDSFIDSCNTSFYAEPIEIHKANLDLQRTYDKFQQDSYRQTVEGRVYRFDMTWSEEREHNATMDSMRQCIIQKKCLEIEEKKLYSNDYNLQKIIRDLRSKREHTWGDTWDALTRRIRQYQTKLNQIRSKTDQKNKADTKNNKDVTKQVVLTPCPKCTKNIKHRGRKAQLCPKCMGLKKRAIVQ
jgi:hypothetical protein